MFSWKSTCFSLRPLKPTVFCMVVVTCMTDLHSSRWIWHVLFDVDFACHLCSITTIFLMEMVWNRIIYSISAGTGYLSSAFSLEQGPWSCSRQGFLWSSNQPLPDVLVSTLLPCNVKNKALKWSWYPQYVVGKRTMTKRNSFLVLCFYMITFSLHCVTIKTRPLRNIIIWLVLVANIMRTPIG